MKLMDKFSVISDWIIRLVWTNLVWLFLVLIGGIVLGFMPATIVLFTITRKWARGELDISVWKLAWPTYKKAFIPANLAGGVFASIALFLYADLRIVFELMQGFWSMILYFFLMFLLFLVGIALLQYFTIFVHFQMKNVRAYVVQSFLLAFTSLKNIFMMVVGLVFCAWLISKIPAFILFISGVLPSYWVMKINLQRFKQMEPK
ncbi:hypothetical protein C2D64_10320 [Listeria ivanovii]|uniref:YesL family protein n=1 Tax=Listeria ivanovii TaxID=1638 RepID=UPI000DA980C8|nr:YesL family protein [Listeria ivanovii]PZG32753.1 hypothetical protein C2D64_10320 [Listeria ivanovii]PZG47764.1 hypothetical protein C2D66_06940 [Listeria ivanovii]PZH10350.1 hypothetical protein C2D65_10270 [Listeria ivanovii]